MLSNVSKDFVIDHRIRHVNKNVPLTHSHQYNEIYFLQSGKCNVYIDNETYSIEELVRRAKKPGLLVALDGVQDPHNVGAILRTCDCTGVDGVILTKHNSCGLTPTVVKASTGAAYTVPVSIVTNLSQTLRNLKQEGYWVVGTDMKDAREYREGMYDSPTVLVIGSEGQGISNLVKKQCDYMVYLPMVGSITSLNASVAAAVLMYEVYNQRNPIK